MLIDHEFKMLCMNTSSPNGETCVSSTSFCGNGVFNVVNIALIYGVACQLLVGQDL